MILAAIVVFIYLLALLFVFGYALIQLNLTISYIRFKRTNRGVNEVKKLENFPHVTIQLPLFNELYVIDRLLDCIAEIDYPHEKLEIQVLDDSTDESLKIAQQKIAVLQQKGLDIQHLTRKDRKNYKAGALKAGLKSAKGEFIAIFDADFLPQKDWLKQTLPFFDDGEVGVVQTRWGHINRDFSTLTKAQAFALDYHFHVEQVGRLNKGYFINFNGTAGIWRKACIYDAGNWHGDTLTEDLDLSYRAQLKGWRIHYLAEVVTPAELPITISAARSQQFRWNKGGAENFRKSMGKVLRSPKLTPHAKLHAAFHLLNSSVFFAVIALALLSVPLVFIQYYFPVFQWVFRGMTFFVLSTLIFLFCYWVSFREEAGSSFRSFMRFLVQFFSFFTIAIGLSWNNAVAVLEGHLGKKSAFIRTPKFNVSNFDVKRKKYKYTSKTISNRVIAEGILMVYFALGFGFVLLKDEFSIDFVLLPFLLLLFLGFGFVFFQSLFNRN